MEICKSWISVRTPGTIDVLIFVFLMFLCDVAMAQGPSGSSATNEGKAMETVTAFSQNLSQWAVTVLGGSAALLLGTSHVRPPNPKVRLTYLMFLPGWACLIWSVRMGVAAQKNSLALLLLKKVDEAGARGDLNDHLWCQIVFLEAGVVILSVWLVIYACFWIFGPNSSFKDGKG